MAATRVSALRRVLITCGEDGQPLAAREERKRQFWFDRWFRDEVGGARGSRTRPSAPPEGGWPGATSPRRSDRSRIDQRNHIIDHYTGYVLARRLGTYGFWSFRTPLGTTVAQGRDALRILRVGLAKRFPYKDGLVVCPAERGSGIRHVSGCGWFANYSLESSQNYSPHFHLMLATLGYDIAAFERASFALWERGLSRVLGRPYVLGAARCGFSPSLGPGHRPVYVWKETD